MGWVGRYKAVVCAVADVANMETNSVQLEKVHALLGEYSTAMLITCQGDGTLHARPMAIADLSVGCGLRFITNDQSPKMQEIQTNSHVYVVCQKENSSYLSIAGTASVVFEREGIEAVWDDSFLVWFPKGKEDPHLALITVVPQRIEYWESHEMNWVSNLWEAARSYVSGERTRTQSEVGHGVVTLG